MSRSGLAAAALLRPPPSAAGSKPDGEVYDGCTRKPADGEIIEEAITVNQRALIDKILARYAAEFTVFRELLQNADDAGAQCCQLRFDTRQDFGGESKVHAASSEHAQTSRPNFKAPLHHWTFKNDGKVFGQDDWARLRRIAEGNPDPDRIGAFGVGFYSLFSICEEPIVSSGDSLMGFFWRGDSLYTRRARNPHYDAEAQSKPHKSVEDPKSVDDCADRDTNPVNGLPWTTFHMKLREPAPLPDTMISLCQFLATSLTFTTRVRQVELYWDDQLLLSIRKILSSPVAMLQPSNLSVASTERMMRVDTLQSTKLQMNARVMQAVLDDEEERRKAKASRLASLASKLTGSGAGGASAAAAMGGSTSFFGSKSGIGGFLRGAFSSTPAPEPKAAPTPPPRPAPPSEQPKPASNPLDLVEASVHLRIATANINVSVDRAFEREIERSTKKPPPKKTQLSLIFTGKDEYDASMESSGDGKATAETDPDQQLTGVRQVFQGLMPRLSDLGNVFIGFRTHQTTSFSGHLAARFIPTVERESMDFVDRYCAKWNLELLSMGGYVARAVYEDEMDDISKMWKEMIGAGARTKDDDKTAEWLLGRALHIMRFFTFRPSSPSSRIQQTIEACFYSCSRQPTLTLASISGPRPSSQVRFPNATLAKFIKDVPTLPFDHIDGAKGFVAQVRSRGLVQDIMMDDVFNELAQRTLSADEMIACLKWWISVANHPAYDASLRTRLINNAMLTVGDKDNEKIQPLGGVRHWLNPSRIPTDAPLPASCLSYSVSSQLNTSELSSVFGWVELPVDDWVAHIVEISSHVGSAESSETDICTSPAFSEKFFGILSRAWGSVAADRQGKIVSMVSGVACLPTRKGMKPPSESYFSNVSLFEDLPIVEFPTAPVKGNLQKLLTALNVGKHVELQMIFDRLVAAGGWSHVDLLTYLSTNKETLSALELERLRKTAMLPKHGEVGPMGKDGKPKIVRYRASQLFEPTDTHKALGLPVLDWPGKPWRSTSDEAKFAFELGLQRHPSVVEVLELAADPSDATKRKAALSYFFDKHDVIYRDTYNLSKAAPFAFVPCTITDPTTGKSEDKLCRPQDACTNEAAAVMGFPVVNAEVPMIHVSKLQIRRDPLPSLLMAKLVEKPTLDQALAKRRFEYLATCTDFTLRDYSVLSEIDFIPVKRKAPSGDAETVVLSAPRNTYFGSSTEPPQFKDVFLYCDYGTVAGAFLRNCGVSNEPSIEEVAKRLVAEPRRFYTLVGTADAYLAILRQIASNWNRIRTPLRQEMKRSSFLLASKRIPAAKESTKQVSLLDDDDELDSDAGLLVFDLKRPSEIVIVDDATSHLMFASSVFFAPHEDLLEQSLYEQLGSPRLSRLVEERFTLAGKVNPDSAAAEDVKALVLERTALFLFEKASTAKGEIRKDADWLRNHLDVVEIGGEGIRLARTLRFGEIHEQNVQRASAMASLTQGRLVLHIAGNMEVDWFEVAFALTKHLLTRQKLPDVLLYMNVLSTSLRNLKRRGFHVDKILAQRKAEREAAEQRMREVKQQEELERLSQPTEKDYRKMAGELESMFPDAEPAHLDAILRSQKDNHLTNAANSILGTPYPKRQTSLAPNTRDVAPAPGAGAPELNAGGSGMFSSWKNKFAQQRQAKQPYSSLAAGTSSIDRGPSAPGDFPNGVGSNSGTNSGPGPSRAPRHAEEVTPTASIKNNVIKAVQASKPDRSDRVQSQEQVSEVKEASNGSYCDVTGVAADLRLAAEVAGMRVFLSPELEPAMTLSENREALERLISQVYKPVGEIFGLDPRSLNVFSDVSGPNIAFNRGGTIFLNFRYYKEWHDDLVREGKLTEPLISTYFTVAHEIAHNAVHAHNAEHEFYFSAIAEQYLTTLYTHMVRVGVRE